jgi:hypothetical protein
MLRDTSRLLNNIGLLRFRPYASSKVEFQLPTASSAQRDVVFSFL